MTTAVAKAAEWADALARAESDGCGDYGHALLRVARRLHLSPGTLSGLLYRRPKRIWADTYLALEAAYEAMREKQLRALEHDIETKRRTGRISEDRLAEAEALVRAARSEEVTKGEP